ncbi:hypothetical protein QA612_22100 [Evansella sp. AB-P1]|uniref:hypothetical protein n=1 Tax=Evansella sp. AB-P1 TaxID=3037653 RepID=UPI00241E8E44|nr:hypothetical protein [Evansella sp. AB-P1]MDG5790137.1 hypothetical protein [Evansella sp. AB-P1]
MKIEMGESIMFSWLRHIKKCQSVQLNWKPSTAAWELHNKEDLKVLMNKVSNHFENKYRYTIFKNNQSYSQLLQQGEIDVLGVEIQNGLVAEIYGIDIAFHENGLNYGGTQATVERIVKKLVRTAMIIIGYYNTRKGEIIFASPKINQAVYAPLKEAVDELNILSNDLNLGFSFKLFANSSFKNEVFIPVYNVSKLVTDTSELYMRSIQLNNLFIDDDRHKGTVLRSGMGKLKSEPVNTRKTDNEASTTRTMQRNEMKIGQLVRKSFTDLRNQDLITSDMLNWLMDAKYCKTTFDVNYPVLKKVKHGTPLADQRLIRGYNRYWKDALIIQNEKYLLCNDWYDRNRNRFERWLDALKK